MINEPTVPETISILRGIKEKYEVHHGCTILDASLVSAATLAHRYLTSRKLVSRAAFDCRPSLTFDSYTARLGHRSRRRSSLWSRRRT